MDHSLRQDWLDQQTEIAWELADDLDGSGWSHALAAGGRGADRRSTTASRSTAGCWPARPSEGVHLGAYGRGMSAYGLGFSVVKDITAYEQG